MTGEKEAKGGNEKTNDFIVASNEKNCDTSSDEEMEIESELDSDEVSDVEDEYEKKNLYKEILTTNKKCIERDCLIRFRKKKEKKTRGF